MCHLTNWNRSPPSDLLTPYTDLISNQPMRTLIAPLMFTFFCGWAGVQLLQSASATVNTYQERQAEALCQADPSYCK